MPKPANNTIGSCPCPICGGVAEVRKYRQRKKLDPNPDDGRATRWRGKLYLYCPAQCKTVKFENQNWILDNATITGEAEIPKSPQPTPEPTGDDPIPPPPAELEIPKPKARNPKSPPAPKAEPRKSKLEDWFL